MGDTAVQADEGRVTHDEFHARDRAAFLAGDDSDDSDDTDEAQKPAKKPAPKSDESDDDDLEQADLDDTESDEDEVSSEEDETADDDDESEDSDEDDDEDESDDPQLKKRLAQVRRTEQRSRDRIAQERTALQREVEAWKPRVEKVEKFETLAKRVKYETADVLLELGLTEDDFEEAARDLYSRSPKGAADPKNREAVARTKREREMADELGELKKKLADREERERQTTLQREADEQAEQYLRGVEKRIDGEQHPLAAKLREKNPTKLRTRLSEVALELARKIGKPPSAKLVLARFEKIRRAELEELGVDTAAIAAKTKTTTKKTGEKTTAGKGAKPAPASRRDDRDSIVAELEAGDFD